jgi:trk system potassium uptake protein
VHVVIVGCGRVGSTLALNLVSSGHSVAVVDRKSDAFFRLRDNFAGQTITGIGFDRDVLEQAGIKQASAVAAVTNVARISDPKRAEIYERLGIATVATVKWTSDRILRRILPDLPAVEWTDPSSSVVLIERAFPDILVGEKVLELEIKGARISALRRLSSAVIPDSKTLVQQGDIGYFAVEKNSVVSLDEFLKKGTS